MEECIYKEEPVKHGSRLLWRIAGVVLSGVAALWWYNTLQPFLGDSMHLGRFRCLLTFGSGKCSNLWFIGLQQTNMVTSLVFYLGLALLFYAVSLRLRVLIVLLVLTLSLGLPAWNTHIKHSEQIDSDKVQLRAEIQQLSEVLNKMPSDIDNYLQGFSPELKEYEKITHAIKDQWEYSKTLQGHQHGVERVQINAKMVHLIQATKREHQDVDALEKRFRDFVKKTSSQLNSIHTQCNETSEVEECKKVSAYAQKFKNEAQRMQTALDDLNREYQNHLDKQQFMFEELTKRL